MRRLVLVITFVCITVSSVIIVTEANIIRVPQEHKAIQAALNVSKKGDTIIVAPGKYREELSLKDGVTLEGSGETSVLNLTVKALNVKGAVISDFVLEGGTKDSHFGIFCRQAEVTVKNMTIVGFHHGISSEASKIIVKHNTIVDSFNVGIYVTTDSEALIEENQVIDNEGAGMIISSSGRNILVVGNALRRNDAAGIECTNASPTIRRNVITQNTFGILLDNAKPDIGTTSDPGLNLIYDNKEGDVVNLGRDIVSAQQNYWGKPDGPCANCIVGRVEYKPWLRQESPGEKQAVSSKAKFPTIWGWLKK
ncbi:right-handed parallel beta-helix repeat-containing protein [bacterium]|nr:right-handed parallel beta-helix repeat-containing protein [bacterium]